MTPQGLSIIAFTISGVQGLHVSGGFSAGSGIVYSRITQIIPVRRLSSFWMLMMDLISIGLPS